MGISNATDGFSYLRIIVVTGAVLIVYILAALVIRELFQIRFRSTHHHFDTVYKPFLSFIANLLQIGRSNRSHFIFEKKEVKNEEILPYVKEMIDESTSKVCTDLNKLKLSMDRNEVKKSCFGDVAKAVN